MEDFGLAQWLAGGQGRDLEAGRTRTYDGVALSDSSEGRVTVDLGGDSVTSDEEQGVELPCAPNVKAGDRISVTVVNGSPTVTGVVGGGDRTAVVIDELSGEVGEVRTVIRQYEDGVLVCKAGNGVGALVNADGSFDVARISWSEGVPDVIDVLTSLTMKGASFFVGGNMRTAWIDPYGMDLNGFIFDTNMHYSLEWDPDIGDYVVTEEIDAGMGNPDKLPASVHGRYSSLRMTGNPSAGIRLVAENSNNKIMQAIDAALGFYVTYYDGSVPSTLLSVEPDGTVSVDKPAAWRTALGITPANIGALPIDGGTLTGVLTIDGKETRPKSGNITDGTAVSTTYGNGSISFVDSAGTSVGFVRPMFNSSGQWLMVYARSTAASNAISGVQFGVDANGGAMVSLLGSGTQDAFLSALGLPTAVAVNGVTASQFFSSTPGGTVGTFQCSKYGKLMMVNFSLTIGSAWNANTGYTPVVIASAYRPASVCPFTVTTRTGMTGYFSASSGGIVLRSDTALGSGAQFYVSGVFVTA